MRDPTKRFGRYLQRWWDAQLQAADDGGPLRGRDVEALASEFRRAAQFEVAQAAFLHRRPDAATAAAVVGRLQPPPSEGEAAVLTEALVRAGSSAQRVRTVTTAGALVTVLALVLRNVLRGR
ncbi:MAG TPA: hypothetical protein VKV23_02245 [Acidimicrobiales bacterium]|nr:hypothetical protein [Acidimicrobiales bacterium]